MSNITYFSSSDTGFENHKTLLPCFSDIEANHESKSSGNGTERKRFRTLAKSYLFGYKKEKRPKHTVLSDLRKNEKSVSNLKDADFSNLYEVLVTPVSSNNSFGKNDKSLMSQTWNRYSNPTNTNSNQTMYSQDYQSPNEYDVRNIDQLEIRVENLKLNSSFLDTRKVVVFNDLTETTGIESILNQIYCGPLEKVVQKNGQTGSSIKMLELHFMEHDDAETFYKFAVSNLFLINGVHPQCSWASSDTNDQSNKNFFQIKHLVYPDDEQVYSQHGGSTIRTGARRCLILKKQTMRTSLGYSNTYENPYILYSANLDEFEVTECYEDFKMFGDIVNITPVVSRKLCISINYYDVRSAILAKIAFEEADTTIHKKYHKTWALWYGKDIADRPCFRI